ncbi:MAG: response regulator transcription factor [Candidatus Eremiobacteraeota bacterium]|nr:response regulator transcription factor [Candidatus Eremiobacteraeota bacterium]
MSGLLILIAEDDRTHNTVLKDYLEKIGYRTASAFDGKEALELFSRLKPDFVLLDVMMPHMDGIEVCRTLRKTSDTPILMLTALSEETDKLIGLEIGADDYLTKPFSLKEVAARIKAIMRRFRSGGEAGSNKAKIVSGDMLIDTEACSVILRGLELKLTATEFKILEVFARHPGKVLSRSHIAELAYGDTFEGFDRTIDAHIKNIRHKCSSVVPEHDFIETSRGLGYKFIAQGEQGR